MIAILSDTHNNLDNLRAALEICRAERVTTLIHCGDVTGIYPLMELEGLRVILTYGNGDVASGEQREMLLRLNPENFAGNSFSGQVEGLSIGAAHGHEAQILTVLVQSGGHDYVFRGHSHRRAELQIGSTRVINPGALGGLHREPRGFCLLDPAARELKWMVV